MTAPDPQSSNIGQNHIAKRAPSRHDDAPNASSGRPPHSIFDQGRQPDSLGTSLRATKKTQ
ncbi:hypothetical protein ELH43_41475 [Rhizobium ruizarguesonis]|nr:hypothetical protein ELH43_41475 [Rhizobium ruizarguesonis]